MPILNYTSKIDYNKTVSDIQAVLSSKGASRVMTDYENGFPSAVSFQIKYNGSFLSFRLPANYRGVWKVLKTQRGVAKSYQTEEHAKKVCWRIIKDWVEAQMAIIESEQADLATVFLPYAIMQNGETVHKNILSEKGKDLLQLN